MNDEFELEMSPLCQALSENGKTVQVEIYRGRDSDWHLEVVDESGNSTVWDDRFPTDDEALKELIAAIQEEGIDAFIGPPA